MKKNVLLMIALILALTLSACGGGALRGASGSAPMAPKMAVESGGDTIMYPVPQADYEMASDIMYDKGEGIAISGISSAYTPPAGDMAKRIRTANLEMETTEFEQSMEALEASILDAGGYIQNANIYGGGYPDAYYANGGRQSAYLNIRIPVDSLDGFLKSASSCAVVISSSTNSQEVSEYYYDTEARLASLKIQEETLLDILKKADTLTDVITLQNALLEVRYQIESAEGTLRRLDNQVAYSTVNINLNEVKRITDTSDPVTLGERISLAFKQSITRFKDRIENFVVRLAGSGIGILIWLIIFAVIFLIVKISVSRSNKRTKAMANPHAPVYNSVNSNIVDTDSAQKDPGDNK